MILRTWPLASRAASPTRLLPALLLTTVRSRRRCGSARRSARLAVRPCRKPPISTVDPSLILETASSASLTTVAIYRCFPVFRFSSTTARPCPTPMQMAATPTGGLPPARSSQGAEDPSSDAPRRMPDSDCTTTDIHDVRIRHPRRQCRPALHRERLIELHRTDLAPSDPARRSAISAASTGA